MENIEDKNKLYKFIETIGIYKLTCIATGDNYIGSTQNIYVRTNQHIMEIKRLINKPNCNLLKNKLIKQIRDYGFEMFTFEIVLILPKKEDNILLNMENFFIRINDSINKGFNNKLNTVEEVIPDKTLIELIKLYNINYNQNKILNNIDLNINKILKNLEISINELKLSRKIYNELQLLKYNENMKACLVRVNEKDEYENKQVKIKNDIMENLLLIIEPIECLLNNNDIITIKIKPAGYDNKNRVRILVEGENVYLLIFVKYNVLVNNMNINCNKTIFEDEKNTEVIEIKLLL